MKLRDKRKIQQPAKYLPQPSPKRPRRVVKRFDVSKQPKLNDQFAAVLGRVGGLLKNIRFYETMIEAYENSGWSASKEKLMPHDELNKAKKGIRKNKARLRETLRELLEGEDAKKERRLHFDEDGISGEDIYCAVCDDDANEAEDNDIVLCDLEGCNRGFHQKCCKPHVTMSEIEDNEDWFCRRCSCFMQCLNEINDHFKTDFDSYEEVFPQEELDDEESDTENQTKSRRGRIIKKPKTEARATWDTHSFGSDTNDDDFSSSDSDDESESEDETSSESGGSVAEILPFKRQRKTVDYQKLANQIFKSEEEVEDKDFVAGVDEQLDTDATSKELLAP